MVLLASCTSAMFGRRTWAPRVIGIVEEPQSDSLRIRVKGGAVKEVRTDDRTHYTKWLTQQPWTIDKMVTAKSVTVGRCVHIVLRTQDVGIADRVEVSLDKAGTFQDPCKSLR